MYHQLATRFARNAHQITGRTPLDNDALRSHIPSIFAGEAHDSRSDRYIYVPTIEIVQGLRREGCPNQISACRRKRALSLATARRIAQ